MADDRSQASDWAGDVRTLVGFWVLPAAVMAAALLAPPVARGGIWVAMLIWMGIACLVNARRCARTHCRITGPFFLVMAAVVAAYALGLISLGPNGWALIGLLCVGGFAALWWGSERLFGKFAGSTKVDCRR